ncbi:MAG TPA: hypothetical protein VGS19_30555 [Streptosporangiaceae bacterium]|nr:hypothetical protein [Streptosporangiaceae bacterium]
MLEFTHPMLGLLGLGCWFVFVATKTSGLAWTSIGILVAALVAGTAWLVTNALGARQQGGWTGLPRAAGHAATERSVPVGTIVLHGLAALATIALATLTVLTAVSR